MANIDKVGEHFVNVEEISHIERALTDKATVRYLFHMKNGISMVVDEKEMKAFQERVLPWLSTTHVR